MKNYSKSAQFAAILVAIFAWGVTLAFPIRMGDKYHINTVFLAFAILITFLIPFCSTKPD